MVTETAPAYSPPICAVCHQAGGWRFKNYGDGVAHDDCLERVGADERPTLEALQAAERSMTGLGYCFRDSCGRMTGESYHEDNVRRYHIWGYDYHFASWSIFQAWLSDAWAYVEHLQGDGGEDDWDDDDADRGYD